VLAHQIEPLKLTSLKLVLERSTPETPSFCDSHCICAFNPLESPIPSAKPSSETIKEQTSPVLASKSSKLPLYTSLPVDFKPLNDSHAMDGIVRHSSPPSAKTYSLTCSPPPLRQQSHKSVRKPVTVSPKVGVPSIPHEPLPIKPQLQGHSHQSNVDLKASKIETIDLTLSSPTFSITSSPIATPSRERRQQIRAAARPNPYPRSDGCRVTTHPGNHPYSVRPGRDFGVTVPTPAPVLQVAHPYFSPDDVTLPTLQSVTSAFDISRCTLGSIPSSLLIPESRVSRASPDVAFTSLSPTKKREGLGTRLLSYSIRRSKGTRLLELGSQTHSGFSARKWNYPFD
jgi:hypothetical protein